jgi:hypothetical protein
LRHLVIDQRSAESNLSAAWSASWESFVKTKLMVSMMSGECPPNPPNDPYFPRREKPGVFKLVQTSRPPMYDNRCQELVRSVAKVSKDADGDSTDHTFLGKLGSRRDSNRHLRRGSYHCVLLRYLSNSGPWLALFVPIVLPRMEDTAP